MSSGFTYPQPTFRSPIYNPAYYLSLDASGFLTYAYAQTLYLGKNDYRLTYISGITAGTATPGIAMVPDSLNALTGLSSLTSGTINATTYKASGATASFAAISGVTAGTASASKALIIDSSLNIAGINSLNASVVNGSNGVNVTKTNGVANSPLPGDFASLSGLTLYNYNVNTQTQIGMSFLVSSSAANAMAPGAMINHVRTGTNSIGDLVFSVKAASDCVERVRIVSDGSLNILAHDGSTVGLKLGGTLVTASASELNYVDCTAGTAAASKALVLDASRNITNINALTASQLSGTLQTPAQANITSLGTLSSLTTSGQLYTSSTANATSPTTGALRVDGGAGIASDVWIGGYLQVNARIETKVDYNHLICSTPLAATTGSKFRVYMADAFESGSCWLGMQTAHALKLCTSDSPRLTIDSAGLINVTNSTDATSTSSASLTLAGGLGIAKSIWVGTGINGTIMTAAQANITSLGTLTGLTCSGQLSITSTTDSTSSTTGSFTTAGGAGIAKVLNVGTKLFVGTQIQTDGVINVGNASTQDMSILRGTSSCAFRIGSGETAKNSMTMQWTYVSSGSNSNRLSFDPYGTANALVITAAGYVGIGQSAPTVPLYVSGSVASITVGSTTTATLSAGSLLSAQSGTFLDNCAVYIADGCLKVGVRGIYISSDRRIKKDIVSIPNEEGERFVRNVLPRKYALKTDSKPQLGYIAQELCPDFSSVITMTENSDMHADPDDPRSIEGYQLSVSYERIIPILHAALRKAFEEIDSLKAKLSEL